MDGKKANNKSVAWKLFQFTGYAATFVGFALFIITSFIGWRNRMNSSGVFRKSYEGVVAFKSVQIPEGRQGPGARFRLLIQPNEGNEFEVVVDREIYDHAKVGMTIQKDESGVRLDNRILDEPEKAFR